MFQLKQAGLLTVVIFLPSVIPISTFRSLLLANVHCPPCRKIRGLFRVLSSSSVGQKSKTSRLCSFWVKSVALIFPISGGCLHASTSVVAPRSLTLSLSYGEPCDCTGPTPAHTIQHYLPIPSSFAKSQQRCLNMQGNIHRLWGLRRVHLWGGHHLSIRGQTAHDRRHRSLTLRDTREETEKV